MVAHAEHFFCSIFISDVDMAVLEVDSEAPHPTRAQAKAIVGMSSFILSGRWIRVAISSKDFKD